MFETNAFAGTGDTPSHKAVQTIVELIWKENIPKS